MVYPYQGQRIEFSAFTQLQDCWAVQGEPYFDASETEQFQRLGSGNELGAFMLQICGECLAIPEATMLEIEIMAAPGISCCRIRIGRTLLVFILSFVSLSRWYW
jgi:hypothetical protein